MMRLDLAALLVFCHSCSAAQIGLGDSCELLTVTVSIMSEPDAPFVSMIGLKVYCLAPIGCL